MTMQPSIFDTDWAAAAMGDISELMEGMSSYVREVDYMDESLQDEIRQIIVRQRTVSWALSSHGLRDALGDRMRAVAGVWIISQIILDTARLINHYLQGRPIGCVALAMICSLICQLGDPPLGRQRVFSSLPAIFGRLKSESLRFERCFGNENAQLYCLYVGAQLEQQQSSPCANNLWFNHAFATKAEEAGLRTWEDVRKRLLGFLYLPQIKPAGEDWVQETLSTGRGPENSAYAKKIDVDELIKGDRKDAQETQADSYKWIDVTTPGWRSKAPSHLTRKQQKEGRSRRR